MISKYNHFIVRKIFENHSLISMLIYVFGLAVCYDSEKSFIGTDFVTAMNHATENQNQLLRNVSQTYGLSDVNSLIYNSNTTNNYDEYAHQRHMTAAPIGYYKVSFEQNKWLNTIL